MVKRVKVTMSIDGELVEALNREVEDMNKGLDAQSISLSRHVENILRARWNRSEEVRKANKAVVELGVV